MQVLLEKIEWTSPGGKDLSAAGTVCAQGGWDFSGSFLSVITLVLQIMTSP